MSILIVRTEPGASAFAAQLCAAGLSAIACSVTEIRLIKQVLEIPPASQGIIFTSAQAVRAFVELGGSTKLPVYVVGDSTADSTTSAGFDKARSASSDVRGLIDLIRGTCAPEDGPLYYPAAFDVAGDIPQQLKAQGYTVMCQAIYQAAVRRKLSDSVQKSLRTRTATGAALFSSRNAATFCTLVDQAGHRDALSSMYALCISENVAASLRSVCPGATWQRILVAERPNADAMMAALPKASSDGKSQA